MKKIISIFVIGLILSGTAEAATAFYTGQMTNGQSVTGQFIYNCQYRYGGNLFWRSFGTYCPNSIEIY